MKKKQLKNYLLTVLNNAILSSNGREVSCSCAFCGDTKRHLTIGPFDDSDSLITYNCFRCGTKGIVNQEFLDKYGVTIDCDPDILTQSKVSYRSKSINDDFVYNVYYHYITNSDTTYDKLKYINDRLGLALTYQDCMDNKIVLNLYDLLQSNKITNYTRHPNIVKQLNDSFIGFLSRTNASLNMRLVYPDKVYDGINKRYINYNLFPSVPSDDYYVLPNTIDLSKRVYLYIAEGPFDILSIYYNVIRTKDNRVFVAGRGKAYDHIIRWFITTYGVYDLEIHLFPDADIQDYEIDTIVSKYKVFGYDFYIHRNARYGEKDYGVPLYRIRDHQIKI